MAPLSHLVRKYHGKAYVMVINQKPDLGTETHSKSIKIFMHLCSAAAPKVSYAFPMSLNLKSAKVSLGDQSSKVRETYCE